MTHTLPIDKLDLKLKVKEIKKDLNKMYPNFKFMISADYAGITVDVITGDQELNMHSVHDFDDNEDRRELMQSPSFIAKHILQRNIDMIVRRHINELLNTGKFFAWVGFAHYRPTFSPLPKQIESWYE